jgi:hypothetical protein
LFNKDKNYCSSFAQNIDYIMLVFNKDDHYDTILRSVSSVYIQGVSTNSVAVIRKTPDMLSEELSPPCNSSYPVIILLENVMYDIKEMACISLTLLC